MKKKTIEDKFYIRKFGIDDDCYYIFKWISVKENIGKIYFSKHDLQSYQPGESCNPDTNCWKEITFPEIVALKLAGNLKGGLKNEDFS